MSLTAVHGPLSGEAAGRFNFELRPPGAALYLDPMPYRIRAIFEGETVVDAHRPYLLHESGRLPVYYFEADELRLDLFERQEGRRRDEHKGEAERWTLRVGERAVPDAAWSYVRPAESAGFLDGLYALEWGAADEWFCEDEQLYGHPRDPYSRIDVYRTNRHLRVLLDGELLAETRRASALYETGLPSRYYIPAEDVRTELLVPSRTAAAAPTKARRATGRCGSATGLSTTSSGRTPIPSTTASPYATYSASSTSASTWSSTGNRLSGRARSSLATTSRAVRALRRCAG